MKQLASPTQWRLYEHRAPSGSTQREGAPGEGWVRSLTPGTAQQHHPATSTRLPPSPTGAGRGLGGRGGLGRDAGGVGGVPLRLPRARRARLGATPRLRALGTQRGRQGQAATPHSRALRPSHTSIPHPGMCLLTPCVASAQAGHRKGWDLSQATPRTAPSHLA